MPTGRTILVIGEPVLSGGRRVRGCHPRRQQGAHVTPAASAVGSAVSPTERRARYRPMQGTTEGGVSQNAPTEPARPASQVPVAATRPTGARHPGWQLVGVIDHPACCLR